MMATLTYSRGPGWRASSGSSATAAGRVCSGVSGTSTLTGPRSHPSLTGRDEVDHGEDDDPDDVDEVPVQPHQLDRFALPDRKPSVQGHPVEREQHQDAARDVRPVEAGQGEEARGDDVRLDRHPFL